MGEPQHILRLEDARQRARIGARRRLLRQQIEVLLEHGYQVVTTAHGPILLPLDARPEHDGGGFFPEGFGAALRATGTPTGKHHALVRAVAAEHVQAGWQQDDAYAAATHAAGALDRVLVTVLRRAGLRLEADGETLWVGPERLLTPELREQIAAQKETIMAVVKEDHAR